MKHKYKISLKQNFIYQMLYEVLIIILPLILSPYLSRILGADALGTYTYYYVIANYFVLFSILGLKNHGKRTIAQCRDHDDELNREFSNLATLHIAISLVCCLAYAGYICLFAKDRLMASIMAFQVLSGLFDISWLYFGLEQFKLTVLRTVITKILTVIAIFCFVHTVDDLPLYGIIMSVGMLVNQLILWIPLKKYVHWVKPNPRQMLAHLKPMLLLFIPGIAVSLYKLMDKLMLGDMSSHAQLGFYDNAEKIVNLPMTIITSFGAVMIPRISNLIAHKDNEKTKRYTEYSFYYIMWLAYAFAFGVASISNVFAPVFWGEDFRSVNSLMMGLAITIPFFAFANIIRTQYLIPQHRDKDFLVSVIAGAVVNLLLNLCLIPRYHAYGAVIATVAAETTVCFIQAFCVRKDLPVLTYFKRSLVFIPFAVIMFIAVYVIGTIQQESIRTLVLQILSGIFIYIALSCAYFYYKKDAFFMKLIHKLKK